MRFAQIAKGTRAEKRGSFLFRDTRVQLLWRPLTAGEETDCVAKATVYAKTLGVQDSPYGIPVYEAALYANIIACGAMDPDSPPNAREPIFESGDEALRELDVDTIATLHAEQRAWQEECSPTVAIRQVSDIPKMLQKMGVEERDIPFEDFSPRTQRLCFRFMVSLLRSSPAHKGLFTSRSSTTTPSSDPPSQSETPKTEGA